MRTKFKKTIKLSYVDKVWDGFVEYGIVKPLLNLGKVQIDAKFSLEIVGTKIIEDPKMFNLLVKGINIGGKGQVKEAVVFDNNRPDVKYKIVLTDKNYKHGSLVFEADRKLSSRVHEELKNTRTYYRIK